MTRSCPVAELETMGGNSHDRAKLAKMKEFPTDGVLLGKGTTRADGRKMLPAYLFEVKKPEEAKASVRW